jgi:hypothetical protein
MSESFYTVDQTAASRAVLDELLSLHPDAILIGGWGTWVRVGGQMSHDIDLIVTSAQRADIAEIAQDVSTSTHLAGKKWRATYRDIHVDMYELYNSRLGEALSLHVEELAPFAERVDDFTVLSLAAHIATKWAALLDRPDTLPGEKDRHELLNLLDKDGANETPQIIRAASTHGTDRVNELILKGFGYLAESKEANRNERRRLARIAKAWT